MKAKASSSRTSAASAARSTGSSANWREVRRARATQRKDRKRAPVPNAAIVGYTNAGKSSLLRRLTGAEVLVEDKLFATLDTTTRKIALPNKQPLLLTDTVGFVRKLPHRLVEAFNATLEESVLADFLIHLLDATQPRVMEFYNTTMKVLKELGAGEQADDDRLQQDRPCDRSDGANACTACISRRRFSSRCIPAKASEELLHRMAGMLSNELVTLELAIPQSRSDLVARLHREANVLRLDYVGNEVHLVA
ncbi:MAG: 50S ribosome-binding GTPase [Chthoniobacteraceae bacterium]